MPVIEFYVSKDGNDRWSGRLSEPNETKTDGPFASLQRARDVVRYLECRQVNGELRNPVFIYIREGVYLLNEPLKLTPEDSGTEKCPVTYMAYKDEKPVISGGRKIVDWYRKCSSISGHEIWASELPDVKSGNGIFVHSVLTIIRLHALVFQNLTKIIQQRVDGFLSLKIFPKILMTV